MSERQRISEAVIVSPITEEAPSKYAEGLKDDAQRTDTLVELLHDPASARIALYLPEEWLPTASQPEYREAYMDAWWKLLNQIDYRADFVDGDIGELADDSPQPLVVKAAHLVPQLLSSGLLSPEDVEYIRREAGEGILGQSLIDAFAPAIARPVSFADYPTLVDQLNTQVQDPTITPARAKWLYESGSEQIARDIARTVVPSQLEQIMEVDDVVQLQIALRSLARLGRHGYDIHSNLGWMQQQRGHDDALVRRQATTSLRHLYHAGIVQLEQVDKNGLPTLDSQLSDNARFMQPEINRVKEIVMQIEHDPELANALYPVVLFAGSRLKGYGDTAADVDTAVLVRPGEDVSDERLRGLFGEDMPKQIVVEQIEGELRVDPDCSHLIYNALWIGDQQIVDQLRHEFTSHEMNEDDRRVALGRLEQDALRYRLMHKGYARHYAVESDDVMLPTGGSDRQSTYWDPGYRRLATQIFAERVRIPKPQK